MNLKNAPYTELEKLLAKTLKINYIAVRNSFRTPVQGKAIHSLKGENLVTAGICQCLWLTTYN